MGREELASIPSQAEDERERKSKNPAVIRLFLVKEHRLHRRVTGVETIASYEDKLDHLLVSFCKDTKVRVFELPKHLRILP